MPNDVPKGEKAASRLVDKSGDELGEEAQGGAPTKSRRVGLGKPFEGGSSQGEQLVASGSEDGSVVLWGLQDRQVKQRLEGHTDTVLAVACHPFECQIASGGSTADRAVRIWTRGPMQ
mmetsp:Transcript_23268/g.52476  ORF Transcript_23268/g.52476 Transcript_23268/m.52476 type:complete len:118 (+) Transcript_23268:870-1223(+)